MLHRLGLGDAAPAERLAWRGRIALAAAALAGLAIIWSAATVPLEPREQAELAAASIVAFLICDRVRSARMTMFLVVLSAAVSLRYIVWRVTDTLEYSNPLQAALSTGLALAELYAILVMALGYIQTITPLERKPIPLPEDPADWPMVDVYIPTYNEDLSVVRATVLAALTIDWPADKLRVYILDDGRRRAFRDFAESCGAGYIIRPDNAHAKAGNLNHALKQTDAPFIAVFDCDHIPTRAFLQMTMGWMVREPTLAAIQTPHHFYSPDPFQRNLAAGTRVPSEGNMFYGLVQPGNDFWNASFFCGSCAVIRRAALESIGGFAVETVTEDAHTALKLHRAGWDSAYLRLPLAAGLATERLILHIGQRIRWARGMIQILRIDNPLFGRGLKFAQRLCYLNAMVHFLFAIPRVVFLTAPLAYLFLGQNIIAASPLAIIAYALPHIFHSVATNSRVQRNWRHSFWSEIYETVLALFLVRVTIATLISPRRGKFNVTDKGGLLSNGYFDMRAVYPNFILAGVLIAGLGIGLHGLLFRHNDALTFQALLLNSIWVTLSLLIVMAALAVGRETRQIRSRARVRAALPVTLWLPDGRVIAGVSRDLSMGGAHLSVERPEGIEDGTDVLSEFDLHGERLLLPARVLRWQAASLQLSWRPDGVVDESRIVEVVFGRADAWTDWDRFPLDRPLASLWQVLVSIRGLFRRPGSAVSRPDERGAAGPAEAAADGVPVPAQTLSRQTFVLRPQAARKTGIAAVIALLALVPGLAAAQAPSTVTVRPFPTAPAAPALTFSQAPASVPMPIVAAPAADPPAAATGAAASPSPAAPLRTDVRRLVLSLHELGAQGPMTMRGTSAIQGVVFGIRADEVVTAAQLNISGAMSPALIPEFSNVTVTLNEQYVGTLPVNRDQPAYGPLALPVNPVFFQDNNRLNFRFTGRYTPECNDPLSGLLWATVSDTSTLALTLERLPAQRDLARLPLPFFDRREKQLLVLPFVVSAAAGNEALTAAGIVASWFGQLADFRGANFPVAAQPPNEGNAVLVVVGRDAPAGVAMPPVNGPTLAVIPSPSDPRASLLVIAGRTGAEAVAAAQALTLGSRAMSGDVAAVQAPAGAVRVPYDAPAWMPTDRPVRLGELVDTAALQGTGYVPGTFHVPFRTAPDLYTWRRRPFAADIAFRAPPGPIVDVSASRLDVGINGMFLHSYPLAEAERAPIWGVDWLVRTLGLEGLFDSGGAHGGAMSVPPYMVFGQNDLQFFFDARPLHRGDCVAIPEDLHMGVDPDSTIDLSRAYRFAQLPNLAYFDSSGFPFTRMADLSDTAVVLADRPGPVELSAFLGMMGRFGALTGYPAIRLAVVRPGEVQQVARRDLLLMGTLGHLGEAAELLSKSPYRMDGARLSVTLPDALDTIRRLFGDTSWDERRRAAAVLSAPMGEGAAMVGMASPFGHGRSVVALLAATPQGLDALVNELRDYDQTPQIQGDLAVLSGGRFTSFRVGGMYSVGSLPLWLWPEYLLRDQPAALVVLMVLASFLLGAVLYWLLQRRAAGRVAASAGRAP